MLPDTRCYRKYLPVNLCLALLACLLPASSDEAAGQDTVSVISNRFPATSICQSLVFEARWMAVQRPSQYIVAY